MAPSRVAYDARLFGAPPTGIGRWTVGLLPALACAAPDVVWVALGDPDALASVAAAHPNVAVLPTRPRRQLIWQLRALPGLLREARADAFLSVWNLVTSAGFRGRQLVWLHDLIPFRATQHGFRATYLWKNRLLWWLARRRLHRLVAVSQFTADDAVATLGVDPARLGVVHPGFDLELFKAAAPDLATSVRERHGLPARYLLAVGGAEPRKNLRLLVDAWRAMPAAAREGAVLALSGSGFRGQGVLDGVDDAQGLGVRDLGRLPDADLMPLLTAATGFLYPSLAEGFGMPPIEAMACGTPVLVAQSTSLPEATGGAALVAEPEPGPFSEAMASLLGDADLRADLVRRGRARASELTWSAAADKVLELLRA